MGLKCCAHAHALLPTGEVGGGNAPRAHDREGNHPSAQALVLRAEGGDTRSGGEASPLRGGGGGAPMLFATGIVTEGPRRISGSVSVFCE